MEKHSVTIENRGKITITDIIGMDAFDEQGISLQLSEGGMNIKGKELHVELLDLEAGKAVISGTVSGLDYTKKMPDKCFFRKTKK